MHLKVFGVITLFPQQVTINGWKRFFHPGFVNPSQKKNLINKSDLIEITCSIRRSSILLWFIVFDFDVNPASISTSSMSRLSLSLSCHCYTYCHYPELEFNTIVTATLLVWIWYCISITYVVPACIANFIMIWRWVIFKYWYHHYLICLNWCMKLDGYSVVSDHLKHKLQHSK